MVESKKALPKEPRGFNYYANNYGPTHHGGGGGGMHHHLCTSAVASPFSGGGGRHIYGFGGGYGNPRYQGSGMPTGGSLGGGGGGELGGMTGYQQPHYDSRTSDGGRNDSNTYYSRFV
jgi:hypothetical protein